MHKTYQITKTPNAKEFKIRVLELSDSHWFPSIPTKREVASKTFVLRKTMINWLRKNYPTAIEESMQ